LLFNYDLDVDGENKIYNINNEESS